MRRDHSRANFDRSPSATVFPLHHAQAPRVTFAHTMRTSLPTPLPSREAAPSRAWGWLWNATPLLPAGDLAPFWTGGCAVLAALALCGAPAAWGLTPAPVLPAAVAALAAAALYALHRLARRHEPGWLPPAAACLWLVACAVWSTATTSPALLRWMLALPVLVALPLLLGARAGWLTAIVAVAAGWACAPPGTGAAALLLPPVATCLLGLALRAPLQRPRSPGTPDDAHDTELSLLTSRLELAAGIGDLGVWEYDVAQQRFLVDERFCMLYGEPGPGRWLPASWLKERVHPEDLPKLEARFDDALLQGHIYDMRFRVMHPDGSIHWLRSVGKVERDGHGQAVRVVGQDQDVTEEELNRQRLQQAMQRHDLAVRAMRGMVWEYDPVTGRVTRDLRAASLLGLAPDEGIRTLDEMLHQVPPGSREACRRFIERIRRGPDALIEAVLPFYHRDGSLRHLRLHVLVERDADGRVLRATGINIDVTGEVETRERMRALTETLRLATEAGRLSVWAFDFRTRRFDIDAIGREQLGMGDAPAAQWDEVLAFVHPEDRPELEKALAAVENGAQHVEVRYRAGTEERLRWLRSAGRVELDEHGRLHRLLGVSWDITADVMAETALRRVNERLMIALSAVHASVWEYDARTGRLQWDEHGAELFGVDPNGGLRAWEQVLTPDCARQAVETLRTHLRDPACLTFELEYTIRHSQRGLRYIRCVGRNERDDQGRLVRTVGLDLDVTPQRQTARHAEELASRLQLAISVSRLGIWMLDLHTGRSEWNEELYRIFGLDPQQVPPSVHAWEERIHPDDRERVLNAAMRTWTGQHSDVNEYRVVRPDGEVRHVRTILSHVRDPQAGVQRVVGATFDVTAEKRATEAIERARLAAEEANRLKSEFLANMSHEIRTPMNAVIGMTELALGGALPPREHQYIAKANAAARSLLGVLNDILDFSKIEAGRLEVERTEFVLHEVLERVTDVVALQAGEKGLELVVDVDPALPARLVGDPTRVAQVLTNLVANAVKFTEAGRVIVRVAPSAVQPLAQDLRLRFEVADTGIGLSDTEQARLFEAFTQADASTTRRFGGTGLGLVICRRLLQLMGGEIGVRSQPGQGSLFWFELPLGRGATAEPLVPALPPGRQRRVLVVDDDAATRAALARQLRAAGHTVAEAADVDEARRHWALARAQAPQQATAVLIDAGLPEGTGLALATELAGTTPRPHIVLTCRPHEYDALRAHAPPVAAHACLAKPLLPAQLTSLFDGSAEAQHTAPAPLQAPPSLRGMKVLLAEDNPLNRELAIELLQRAGVQVSTASTGAEALAAVQSQEFDVVLMDVQMPDMDGFEATRRVRALGGPRAFVPIIAMTAHAMAGDRERSLAAGMDDHLAKPIDSAVLLRTLLRWGRGRHAGPTHPPAPPRLPPPPAAGPLRVLDVDLGLRACGGNAAIYKRALRRFAEVYERSPVRAGDPPDTQQREAHSLKGAAATLGMSALSELARELELAARAGQPLVQEQLERLERALRDARRAALAQLT